MKKLVLTFVFCALATIANAQVGIGTPTPAESAILDIESENKGVLIPRVSLTSTTDTATIEGAEVNSLLVYNTATAGTEPNEVTAGFYYWLTDHWERIVNQAQLNMAINEINENIEDIHDLINYIAPDNPNAPVNALTHHTVVWNTADNTFHYVTYDGNEYVTNLIDFGALETDTSIVSANTGTELDNDLEIIYNYLKEAHLKDPANVDPDVINITDGVLQSIEHNQNVQQAIIDLIQQGGTVYYGTADGAFTEDVLYYIDGNGDPVRIDTAVVVQGTDNSVASAAQINQIKTNLGDTYSTTNVAFTGDTWVNGDMIYKGVYDAVVVGGTATLQSTINLGTFSGANVISIRLLDLDNQIINTATTDVTVTGGNTLSFRIGTGNMYNVLDSANKSVKVIVEFSAVE